MRAVVVTTFRNGASSTFPVRTHFAFLCFLFSILVFSHLFPFFFSCADKEIGPEGARKLVEVLKQMRNLEKLNLGCMFLPPACAAPLVSLPD